MATYDQIGTTYTTTRGPDARIQALIDRALGDAVTVVNVGAGAGGPTSLPAARSWRSSRRR